MTTIDKTKGKEKLSFEQNTTPITESLRKPDTTMDDKISTAILKTTIEAIPLLTQENFTLWRSRVENMLDLQNLRKNLTEEKGVLTETEELQLRALITSKLDATVHANVINHDNKKDAKKIWKAILNYFPPLKPPIVLASTMI